MELKVKYQYTYFIKPFLIKENSYAKYLLSLLNNKKCKLKIFEKEKDYDIYNYFFQNVREYFFPSFSFDKNKINKFNKMNPLQKSMALANLHCNIFEYILDKGVQGKLSEEEGIFFNIDKIEIVCLDSRNMFFNYKN